MKVETAYKVDETNMSLVHVNIDCTVDKIESVFKLLDKLSGKDDK